MHHAHCIIGAALAAIVHKDWISVSERANIFKDGTQKKPVYLKAFGTSEAGGGASPVQQNSEYNFQMEAK